MTKRKDPKDLKKRGPKEKFTKEEVLSWENEFIQACKTGMSLRSFLGMKGLDRHYFQVRAERDIPELYAILEKGKAHQEEFYRKLIVAGSSGQIKGFQLGGFVWLTKHLLGWWDIGPDQADSLGGYKPKSVYKTVWSGADDSDETDK